MNHDDIDMEISKHLFALSELFKLRAGDTSPYQSPTIRAEAQKEQEAFPRDPLAKSMADLVTPKQLGMIRALSREAGVNPDEECQSVLRCKTDELSKRAASSLIDHLKGLQTDAARRAG